MGRLRSVQRYRPELDCWPPQVRSEHKCQTTLYCRGAAGCAMLSGLSAWVQNLSLNDLGG